MIVGMSTASRKDRVRAIFTCLAFLTILTIVLGSRSHWIDLGLIYTVWGGFLTVSIVVLVKSFGSGGEDPSEKGHFGSQISVLPRSWQSWILGEHNDKSSK